MNLTKLLWGIILTVGLSLLTNLIIYLVEELFQRNILFRYLTLLVF